MRKMKSYDGEKPKQKPHVCAMPESRKCKENEYTKKTRKKKTSIGSYKKK